MSQHVVHQVCDVLVSLARQVDSPRARAVETLARNGEWSQLQALTSVEPADYLNSEHYFRDAIITEFARKSPPLKGDLYQTAVDAFFKCEVQNAATNARLSKFIGLQGPFSPSDLALYPFIQVWRKKIAVVLGALPMDLDFKFSPGSTVSNVGREITIPDKLASEPTVYPASTDFLPSYYMRTAWGRANERAPQEVSENHFFSVPKDARKDRGCCKEASFNIVLQKSVGSYMKHRLVRAGIDLKNGQDRHDALARKCSIDGDLVTLDLSNASDTIARRLVQLLLPEDWHLLLNSLRAPFTMVDERRYFLEKFSSMGNGFTFELETLIFWTLAETCCDMVKYHEQGCAKYGEGIKTRCLSYGDDLILPNDQDVLTLMSKAMQFFGFTVNTEKSCTTGLFRESCGGDYYKGIRVRAYYLTVYPMEPQHWIGVINGLKALRRPKLTRAAIACAFKNLPTHIAKLRGPAIMGDIVIHEENPRKWTIAEEESCLLDDRGFAIKRQIRTLNVSHTEKSVEIHVDRWDPSWCGYMVKAYVPLSKNIPLKKWRADVQLASALYGTGETVTRRGETRGHAVRHVFVPSSMLPHAGEHLSKSRREALAAELLSLI